MLQAENCPNVCKVIAKKLPIKWLYRLSEDGRLIKSSANIDRRNAGFNYSLDKHFDYILMTEIEKLFILIVWKIFVFDQNQPTSCILDDQTHHSFVNHNKIYIILHIFQYSNNYSYVIKVTKHCKSR